MNRDIREPREDRESVGRLCACVRTRWDALRQLGGSREQYAWRALSGPFERILDVGCSYGWTLEGLQGRAGELWGLDVDEEAIAWARRTYPECRFLVHSGVELPFPEEFFDAVILMEVIEHVGRKNKRALIDEAHRVMRPGGVLVFTAPYAGIFSWADPQDFKRRMPGVYSLYRRFFRRRPRTPEKIGHEHLGTREIERLLAGRFEIRDLRHCSLVNPLLSWILAVGGGLRLLPRWAVRVLDHLRAWETGLPCPAFLASFFRITAMKVDPGRQSGTCRRTVRAC